MTITYHGRIYTVRTESELSRLLRWLREVAA